jgi:asparagine synthase (glutamine-hydrolysing)
MCGIAGVASRAADPSLGKLAAGMNAKLAHRGPDGAGLAEFPRCALAHRRLSIIDLPGGAQPMFSPGGAAVVFNGEIYNFRDLRQELSGGYTFRTNSDTEVLLAAWERWGEDSPAHLRGMFAYAIWDPRSETLFLARDRFGKKPIFVSDRDGLLAFASELKSLPAGEPDKIALQQYLALGYVPPARTVRRNVKPLAAGHSLTWRDGTATTRCYWQPPAPREVQRSDAEWEERVKALLDDSVRARLMSDVPLGAFLSGGLDSSTVVALCMKHRGQPFHTFSVRTEGSDGADAQAARLVAQSLGTEHHQVEVACPSPEELSSLFAHFDQPFGDSSLIPTAAVSRFARERVTVSLSGDGADELFGGYDIYALAERAQRLARVPGFALGARLWPSALRGKEYLLRLAAAAEPNGYLRAVEQFQQHERRRLAETSESEAEQAEQELQQLFAPPSPGAKGLQAIDLRAYLPGDILYKVDMAGMAASLEVRSPFLDHALAEELAGLPDHLRMQGGVGKLLLRKIARPLLPPEVLTRRKIGFTVPLRDWLSGPLRPLVQERLPGAPKPATTLEAQRQFTLLSLACFRAAG